MAVTIYHNPSCSTSRNTLAMIRQSGEEPEVIEYLKTPPTRERRGAAAESQNDNREPTDQDDLATLPSIPRSAPGCRTVLGTCGFGWRYWRYIGTKSIGWKPIGTHMPLISLARRTG